MVKLAFVGYLKRTQLLLLNLACVWLFGSTWDVGLIGPIKYEVQNMLYFSIYKLYKKTQWVITSNEKTHRLISLSFVLAESESCTRQIGIDALCFHFLRRDDNGKTPT